MPAVPLRPLVREQVLLAREPLVRERAPLQVPALERTASAPRLALRVPVFPSMVVARWR